MKKTCLAMIAGTAIAVMSMAPVVHGQGYIIKKEALAPDVKYMSGGVGIEERDVLRSLEFKGYDLKLVFAVTPGNYLSYVHVKIKDQTGKEVINAQSNGPWFYADLPGGTYTVVAGLDGEKKTKRVTVHGEGLQRVNFHWRPSDPLRSAGEHGAKAGAVERNRQSSAKSAREAQ